MNQLGFETPDTLEFTDEEDLEELTFPCIAKPATDTGGSESVFLAGSREECLSFIHLLQKNQRKMIIQEYIPLDEGEFTIGVLSLPNSDIVGCNCDVQDI